MKVFIHLKGKTEGPYTIEQIKEMLAQQQIAVNHLAHIEDTFKWIPVSELIEIKNNQSLTYSDSKKEHNSNSTPIDEYKRVCQQCGKVWHSLVSRENQIANNIKFNNCQTCLQAGTCSPLGNVGAAQSTRNVEANQSELAKLLSCPICNSTNFTQEIISYDTKELRR